MGKSRYSSHAVSASTVLKRMVSKTVTEDGRIEREEKLAVKIEKAGELRMFIEVPEYVGQLLGDLKLPNPATTFNASHNRVYGRDPEEIERSYTTLLTTYSDRKKTLVIKPLIFVNFEGVAHGRRYGGSSFGGSSRGETSLKLSLTRLLYEPAHPELEAKNKAVDALPGQLYQWRDNDTDALKRTYHHDRGARVLDYTPELWAKLEAMSVAIANGIVTLHEIISGDNFVPLLLSGKTLALTGPAE